MCGAYPGKTARRESSQRPTLPRHTMSTITKLLAATTCFKRLLWAVSSCCFLHLQRDPPCMRSLRLWVPLKYNVICTLATTFVRMPKVSTAPRLTLERTHNFLEPQNTNICLPNTDGLQTWLPHVKPWYLPTMESYRTGNQAYSTGDCPYTRSPHRSHGEASWDTSNTQPPSHHSRLTFLSSNSPLFESPSSSHLASYSRHGTRWYGLDNDMWSSWRVYDLLSSKSVFHENTNQACCNPWHRKPSSPTRLKNSCWYLGITPLHPPPSWSSLLLHFYGAVPEHLPNGHHLLASQPDPKAMPAFPTTLVILLPGHAIPDTCQIPQQSCRYTTVVKYDWTTHSPLVTSEWHVNVQVPYP